MNKPTLESKQYYDYHKCKAFIREKYGYDERDYLGKYKRKNGKVLSVNDSVEYLDFWHWVVDNYEIHNGCFIEFSNEDYDQIEKDWVKEIYSHYMDEFCPDKNWKTNECRVGVEFYVSW